MIWPRAPKHEAFSQMKDAKSLQLSLKAEGLSSNNLAESVGCVGLVRGVTIGKTGSKCW